MNDRVVSIANMTHEERMRMRLYVESQQDGGNPSQLLELLASIMRDRPWENLFNETSGHKLTFRAFIEEPYPVGIAMSADQLRKLISIKHRYEETNTDKRNEMDAMREAVIEELAGKSGAPIGNKNADKTNSEFSLFVLDKKKQDRPDQDARRIKKDRPDLYARIVAGEMKPGAAMVEAGFRKKTVSIPVDDVRAIARALARHLTVDQIEELTSILAGDS